MPSNNRNDLRSFPDFNFLSTQGKSPLKLHLGCGTKRLSGFVHVDVRASVEPDVVSDVTHLPMFADNSVELIYFCHGLEHIRPYQIAQTLAEWKRVLKPSGILRLSLPDFAALANLYINHKVPLQSIVGAIHGGQDYPDNLHYWSWDFPSLSQILEQVGFVDIRSYDPNQVNPQGYKDFSTYTIANHKISLNIEATKPILIETYHQSPEGKSQPNIQTEPNPNLTPKGFSNQPAEKKKKTRSNKSKAKNKPISEQFQGVSSLFAEAMRLHQQQQYDQALALYQQVLSQQPNHVEALGNLASLLRRQGQLDEAIATYRRVLKLEPNRPEIWFNLGNTLQAKADFPEAENAFQQAIALKPDLASAYFNLGKLLQTQERWEEAAESYRQAITHQPDVARFYCNLGNVLKALGQLDQAVVSHQQAITLDPNYAKAYYNLGNVYKAQAQYPEAQTAYQQALQLQPQFAQAWLNLAGIYQELGNLSEAETAMRQAIAQQPDFLEAYLGLAALLQQRGETESVISLLQTATQQQPDNEDILTQLAIALQKQNRIPEIISAFENFLASHRDSAKIHSNLGSVYSDLGQYNEAIIHLKQAIDLQPDLATAHTNLGFALIQMSRLGEAIKHCQEAILIDPQLGAGYLNLGFALNNQGRVSEGIANFQRVLDIEPDSHSANSNLLYALNYDSQFDLEAIIEAHFNWGKRLTSQLQPTPNITPKKQRKSTRLRIGYLSPDFRQHSVAYFIEPILYHHNKIEFEIFCYANVSKPDPVTERLSQLAEHWRDIYRLDDQQVCEQIQADEIDILVDLAGHTGQNHLPVFANKPAPIQVTYIGYPNTTGLETIDYRLTDAIADPPGMNDPYYTEELIRLPNCFLCYQPPADLPAVNTLPAKTVGRITFGSFNNLPKLTPQVVDLWSRILQAVPNSRLILKVRWFDDASTRDRYLSLFTEKGIDPKRIKLFGKIDDPSHHLAFYGNLDIALDPFPYNGTTTTCEALLMGVPTLTLTGFAHVNRVGQSLLTTVGLSEWVAETPEEYLNKAVTFAEDWEALGQLRSRLQEQVLNSPLCDAVTHTSNLENIYYQFLEARRNSRLF
ncbi:MAG: tetratricopeptide repeat protein [Cyanobacteria bacterium J06592_8]